ncbi:hypothetical protein A946_10030 [Methylacidiphilum kamchatkense Kam1]|uniref:Uncharacterized protein n=1 Tax=Methylacidiphilum kamchatkense Kam1 TaxID=1202785 RepID=A0A0C1UQ51_9BACT|nr:hypothetical protein [Methylacidiphilum kamchatkense]KIE57978.1 hypothetical protein A946_10030 [Methylacidiphilum kamchatkense Kam1]QDQ42411.1 hypothetical protein kam1_1183 [Methylacidiphilum kamchatkense Kam1]
MRKTLILIKNTFTVSKLTLLIFWTFVSFSIALWADDGSDLSLPLKVSNPSAHSLPLKGDLSNLSNKESKALKKNEANLTPRENKSIDKIGESKEQIQKELPAQSIIPNNESFQPIVLDFRITELMELKRIAREIGGNLIITIEPVGITAADLIIPLRNSGLFNVESKDGKLFIVSSNGQQQKKAYEEEIAALSRRQAALLRNIAVLQNLATSENSSKQTSSVESIDSIEKEQKNNMQSMAHIPPNTQEEYPLPK